MTRDAAIARVNDFAVRAPAGVWPNVNRDRFAAGLLERVNDPNRINQGATPLCGPATLARATATSNPDAYAQAAIALFETGQATMGNLRLQASSQLRQAAIPRFDSGTPTPDVDWVVLGSIRDSANWFLSVGGLLGNSVAGITTAGSLQTWLRNAGFTDIREAVHYVAKPIYSVLCVEAQAASRLVSQGYHVMLLVDSDMLKTSNQGDLISMYPDHWITLITPINGIDGFNYDAPVSFTCHTWGGRASVPEHATSPLSKHNFLHKYYGYVAARF